MFILTVAVIQYDFRQLFSLTFVSYSSWLYSTRRPAWLLCYASWLCNYSISYSTILFVSYASWLYDNSVSYSTLRLSVIEMTTLRQLFSLTFDIYSSSHQLLNLTDWFIIDDSVIQVEYIYSINYSTLLLSVSHADFIRYSTLISPVAAAPFKREDCNLLPNAPTSHLLPPPPLTHTPPPPTGRLIEWNGTMRNA